MEVRGEFSWDSVIALFHDFPVSLSISLSSCRSTPLQEHCCPMHELMPSGSILSTLPGWVESMIERLKIVGAPACYEAMFAWVEFFCKASPALGQRLIEARKTGELSGMPLAVWPNRHELWCIGDCRLVSLFEVHIDWTGSGNYTLHAYSSKENSRL